MLSTSTALRRAGGLLALFVSLTTPHAAAAQDVLNSRIALVEADLIAEVDSIAPGQPFQVAVRLRMKDTWHINWRNPGDAGLAPGIEWRLPDGFSAGIVQWPHPKRYRIGPLVIFGYDDEVLLISEITPPPTLKCDSQIQLAASTSWLACQDVCVPGEAVVTLGLPVGQGLSESSSNSEAFAKARRLLPVVEPGWRFSARIESEDFIVMEMTYMGSEIASLQRVFFFPESPGVIENAAAQKLTPLAVGSGYQLRIERSRMERHSPDRINGIFVSDTGWGGDNNAHALRIDVPLRRR